MLNFGDFNFFVFFTKMTRGKYLEIISDLSAVVGTRTEICIQQKSYEIILNKQKISFKKRNGSIIT